MANPIFERLLPAPVGGGYREEDAFIWCGSCIRGEDGRYHLFASRWSKELGFGVNWLFNCEIVRASSSTPEGPYRFEEVVLGRRERHYFDGMNQHNPHIRYWNGTYYLYYMGTTYGGPVPGPGDHVSSERGTEVWNNKRIGLATSPSIAGPWTRMEQPLLEPRRGRWDCTATTNPSVAILADGTTYMIYKSREYASSTLQLGVAVADHPAGPFRRLSDDPILQFSNPDLHVEDPYLWHDGQQFHLLIKDDFKNDSSGLTGEWGAGVYATSADCLHWTICPEPKAYSRTVVWNDGSVKEMCNLERPFLLIEDGVPTHLFAATGTGEKAWHFDHTWNMVIPLAPPEPAVRD
ncbi:glycoside hydrolase family protein [Paenibacillus sp. GCM10027626]|uniref:glycoside hydrolase family protein n=1 Tax=Paenibacillus sp. GCM10027626 TaxID=3273411 RepID=UPI00362CED6C